MTPRSTSLNRAAWWGAVAVAWFMAWGHLASEWRLSQQYQYGWIVPLLFLFIGWQRWEGVFEPTQKRWSIYLLLGAAWSAMGVGEWLRWLDPIWRWTGALLMLGASFMTLAWLLRLGGLPLLRRELFPLLFAWVAVPWPVPLENWVTQGLLSGVVSVTVTLANAIGIAALQHGNVIEVSQGLVGVNEACSGIRSLQASMMTSLFLGEFFRLGGWKRLGLFLGSCGACLVANSIRVLAMTMLVNAYGESVAGKWHDSVGSLATLLTFLSIALLAYLWARPVLPAPLAMRRTHPFPSGWDGAVVFGSAVAIPLTASALFAGMPVHLPSRPLWKLDPGALPSGWTAERMAAPDAVRAALRFSQWDSVRVRSPQGWSAEVIHLFWKPGERMPTSAFSHTPAFCMGSAGWSEAALPEAWTLEIQQRPLPCVAYHLSQGNANGVVIQAMFLGGKPRHFSVQADQLEGGFQRLASRWRTPWQQVTEEIVIAMPDTDRNAAALSQKAECEALLRHLLQLN